VHHGDGDLVHHPQCLRRASGQDGGSPASPEVAAPIARLVDEYEAQDSREARLAKVADKLECRIQARDGALPRHAK
jgi:hypothetical protein